MSDSGIARGQSRPLPLGLDSDKIIAVSVIHPTSH